MQEVIFERGCKLEDFHSCYMPKYFTVVKYEEIATITRYTKIGEKGKVTWITGNIVGGYCSLFENQDILVEMLLRL